MSIGTFFRSGKLGEADTSRQELFLELPTQFTVDELSTELLKLVLHSCELMAQIALAKRATCADEQNQVIQECLIFHWWYLERLIEGRTTILKRLHDEFRDHLWDIQAFREQVAHYESKSEIRGKQYWEIFKNAGGGAMLAENLTPTLVENILCGDTLCVWTPSIQTGATDCIQVFARLVFQALSVPIR